MLNGGSYNGARIVADSTVQLFTRRAAGTRALGWDTCAGSYGCGKYMGAEAYGHTGYTGTSLYESWSLSMFNTLFTSLPVIFMGVFEKDLAASTLLAVPELYTKGQRNGGFNLKVYLGWMFMAAAEAMVVYFCMLSLFGEALFTEDNSIFALGSITYTAVVWAISLKMQYVPLPPFKTSPSSPH